MKRINKSQKGLYLTIRVMINSLTCLVRVKSKAIKTRKFTTYLAELIMIELKIILFGSVQKRMHRQLGIENPNDKKMYATFKSSPICLLESFFLCERLSNVCIKDTERVSFENRKGMKKEFFEQNNLDKKVLCVVL